MLTTIRIVVVFVAIIACGAVASAQSAKLRIDSLDRLESTASKVVDVSVDEKLMGLASKVLRKTDPNDPDVRKVADAIAGIHEIYVRSYEFDAADQYSPADIDAIRSQVKGAGWSRLVNIRSKRDGDNAEVYVLMQGDTMQGLVVIAANPKELTVVNIIGSIDIERLSDLDGEFGVPRIELKRDPKPNGN